MIILKIDVIFKELLKKKTNNLVSISHVYVTCIYDYSCSKIYKHFTQFKVSMAMHSVLRLTSFPDESDESGNS